MEECIETLSQPIHLRTGIEADKGCRCNIERDLARFRKQIHAVGSQPVASPLGDDPLHERQVAVHERGGEGRIHQRPMSGVLGRVHIQQPPPECVADYRRPTQVVAEVLAMGEQDEAIRLRPDEVHNLLVGVRACFGHKGENGPVRQRETRQEW